MARLRAPSGICWLNNIYIPSKTRKLRRENDARCIFSIIRTSSLRARLHAARMLHALTSRITGIMLPQRSLSYHGTLAAAHAY